MKEADRYSPHEDLSEYEKEADNWVVPPFTQKPKDKSAGNPSLPNTINTRRQSVRSIST